MEFITSYTLLHNPVIQLGLDTLFKSAVLFCLVFVVLSFIRPRISSTSAHLILLATFICVALVPIVGAITRATADPLAGFGTLTVFSMSAVAIEASAESVFSPALFLLLIYLCGILILLSLLVHSARKLVRLHRGNLDIEDPELLQRFHSLCRSIGIKRSVTLHCNAEIQSPLSYGLIKPVVIVPEAFYGWEGVVQDEVLLHELNHIKRLDWLSLIFTRLLCSLLWINPLLWIAAKRLHDESEQACDSAIANNENDRIRYAEDLLQLARQQKIITDRNLLAQPMFDGGELTMRIENILEGKISKGITRTAFNTIMLAVALFALAGNNVKLFADSTDGDEALDQEYLPISVQNPQYPQRAVDDEVEGWILFSFTVRADGLIDPNSVAVVDAEPAGYFETSSRNALMNFQFEPRIRDGLAEDVPGVQYLFRYKLSEGGNAPARSAPPARSL